MITIRKFGQDRYNMDDLLRRFRSLTPDMAAFIEAAVVTRKNMIVSGGTGSGKSSLLLMLCRLYAPTEGRVTVGGTDIADMPAQWVRENVGVVLQEPFLFSRTIEENIGILDAPAFTPEQLKRIDTITRYSA